MAQSEGRVNDASTNGGTVLSSWNFPLIALTALDVGPAGHTMDSVTGADARATAAVAGVGWMGRMGQ